MAFINSLCTCIDLCSYSTLLFVHNHKYILCKWTPCFLRKDELKKTFLTETTHTSWGSGLSGLNVSAGPDGNTKAL